MKSRQKQYQNIKPSKMDNVPRCRSMLSGNGAVSPFQIYRLFTNPEGGSSNALSFAGVFFLENYWVSFGCSLAILHLFERSRPIAFEQA
jgi:hypothetical protein